MDKCQQHNAEIERNRLVEELLESTNALLEIGKVLLDVRVNQISQLDAVKKIINEWIVIKCD